MTPFRFALHLSSFPILVDLMYNARMAGALVEIPMYHSLGFLLLFLWECAISLCLFPLMGFFPRSKSVQWNIFFYTHGLVYL